jgi:cystathionine beta-lyase
MRFDFSHDVDRRGTDSSKWTFYGEDVLPMWVADTEFGAPASVIEAIRRRLEHPVFGYQFDSPPLRAVIADRMQARYGWKVDPDWIVPMPGLVMGLNLVVFAATEPGQAVLLTPPIYPPFLRVCKNFMRDMQAVQMPYRQETHVLRYELDFDALEAAITPQTRLFLFCNPHNPTGRVHTQAEIERLADICMRHDLIICADEIHSDLVYSGARHLPIAALAPEVAQRTITLIAPSKTFNIPGLGSSAAIVQDAALRARLLDASYGFGAIPTVLGHAAALGAYQGGQEWLDALLIHLEGNRDLVVDYIGQHLPQLAVTRPEGTFLAWIDCRALAVPNVQRYFLEQAKVALNDGAAFGAGGEGFVRLNFGCSKTMLLEGLEKLRDAIVRLGN